MVCRFVRGAFGHIAVAILRILHRLWGFIWYLPPKKTRELLSQKLTLYGFFIGTALATVAIVLVFNVVTVTIAPKLEVESTSETKVKLKWKTDYEPSTEIEQALQALLTGKAYEQTVWDYEYHEFRFPQSVYDLPSVPRPVAPGELLFLKWRIGSVPPLPSDKDPKEALLPVMGDTWEWNIDPKLMTYIADSPHEVGKKVAWYKIAIAMVGGYSKLFTQGLPIDERIAAIDAFSGATWTFEVKYRVWNSGTTQAKSCRIIPGGRDTDVVAPEDVESNGFVIQPGVANRLEFKLNPNGQFSSLGSAKSNAAEVREKTKIESPPLEVIEGSPWLYVGAAWAVGLIFATVVNRFLRF